MHYHYHYHYIREKSVCSRHCFCCRTWTSRKKWRWARSRYFFRIGFYSSNYQGPKKSCLCSRICRKCCTEPHNFCHVRLSSRTFEALSVELGHYPEIPTGLPHGGRLPISVSKHLLITLWLLGNQESITSIADQFNVTKRHRIVWR